MIAKDVIEKINDNVEGLFYESCTVFTGKVSVSVSSVFKKNDETVSESTPMTLETDVCRAFYPSRLTVECLSCKEFTSENAEYLVSYQSPLTLLLKADNLGTTCSESEAHAVDVSFAGSLYQTDEVQISLIP